jgi:hypothetical protein
MILKYAPAGKRYDTGFKDGTYSDTSCHTGHMITCAIRKVMIQAI